MYTTFIRLQPSTDDINVAQPCQLHSAAMAFCLSFFWIRICWFRVLCFFNMCFFVLDFFLLLFSGYVVAFRKILTIDQIKDSWIHLLHHSPLSLHPHSWSSFSRSYFSICTHVYTVSAPCSPSHTLTPPPPHSHRYQSRDRTYSALLFSDFVKEKKMTFLFVLDRYTGSFLVTFPCMFVL
jgi:hypothetical protein